MIRRLGILVLFFLSGTLAHAKYEVSPLCQRAYSLIWAYKHAEASELIRQEMQSNPDNMFVYYLANLSEFVKIFATEDPKLYAGYGGRRDFRLIKLERAPKNSPYYYYCRAEILLHSAVLRLKLGDELMAALELNKAFRALTSCEKKYPDFLPTKKDLLVFRAGIGAVPSGYAWLTKTLGFKGNLKQASEQYHDLIGEMEAHKEYRLFVNESRMIYAYMCYYLLNQPATAWKYMDAGTQDYASSPFSAMGRANMALRVKKNGEAVKALELHVKSDPAFPHLDYLMGIAKLQRCDVEGGFYLTRYLKQFENGPYVKDAYLKLGWAYLLKGDQGNYSRCMRLVKQYGTLRLDEDKNAVRESARPQPPMLPLLRARLYYDGGLYEEALKELEAMDYRKIPVQDEKAEFYYRYGRVCEAMESFDQALTNYATVIQFYSGGPAYFAPAACLYSAQIWEKRKNTEKARSLYKQTLSFKNYTYKNSFDQKAEAGLRRLE